MANQDDGSDFNPSTRGDSAWKEARERVASRNAEARKAGKAGREAYERQREMVRQTAAAKSHAELVNRQKP